MMKKIKYAVIAAIVMLSGCNKYHPYYDGQDFCLLDSYSGTVLKEDGGDVSVTLQREYEDMFVVEFYGGVGKNHTITVEDPECLDFTYIRSSVKTPPFDYEINPAKMILLPKKLGDTSVTVTDDDTGESMQFYVHIGNAYRALSVTYRGQPQFDNQTVYAFECGNDDNVFEICRGYIHNLEHIVSGRYSFVDIGGILYFEITYPADSDGRPVAGGEDAFRRYQVQFDDGTATDPVDMMWYLNLSELHVQTKDVMPDYMSYFRFVDVTSIDESELTMLIEPYYYPEDLNERYQLLYPYFNTSAAQYVALKLE